MSTTHFVITLIYNEKQNSRIHAIELDENLGIQL